MNSEKLRKSRTRNYNLKSPIGRGWNRPLVTSKKLAVTARFALTMAHEINNPLEAITNLVFLLAALQTSPETQAYIATIKDQLQGLSRIATQALKFHRDSNKPGVFKLNAVLREVLDFYRPQAERQGIVLHQRFETDGAISAFRSEIVQFVTNPPTNVSAATDRRLRSEAWRRRLATLCIRIWGVPASNNRWPSENMDTEDRHHN